MKFRLRQVEILALLLISASLRAQTEPVAATPQRPSNSTNTNTTYPGWLEVESGAAVSENAVDSPILFKLGARENFELFVGVSPIVNVSNGASETGFGDMVVGGRWRFQDGKEGSPALAGQFSIKLPTADENKGLGSGEVDYHLLFILSQSLAEFGLDFNAGFISAGIPSAGSDEQVLGILTLSRPLVSRLSGYGEILVNHSFEFDNTATIGSAGVAYTATPRLVFDAAVNFNISNAPFDVQVLTGLTFTLAEIL